MSYQLFPGLKHALENRRSTRFGVPPRYMERYLKSEAFVVDMRGVTSKELNDMEATYQDLRQLGLHNLPVEDIVIFIMNENGFLATFSVGGAELESYVLADSEYKHLQNAKSMTDPKSKDALLYSIETAIRKLVVMLATTNIEKIVVEPKAARPSFSRCGKHKLAKAGYTILRPPQTEPHEPGQPTGITKRPHFRRGHIRRYDPVDRTQWIWVSPCFIHGEPEVARKAYLVKEDPHGHQAA